MKPAWSTTLSVAVTTLTGVAVAVLAASLGLESSASESAQVGCLASTATGLVALLWKGRVATGAAESPGALRALFAAQAAVLGLRVVVVLAGALVLRARGEDALVSFVLAFFVVYAVQQVTEVRLLLTARGARPVSRSQKV
jgi:hypothetical protein